MRNHAERTLARAGLNKRRGARGRKLSLALFTNTNHHKRQDQTNQTRHQTSLKCLRQDRLQTACSEYANHSTATRANLHRHTARVINHQSQR